MSEPRQRAGGGRPRRSLDVPRRTALAVLRAVTGEGAYANLALAEALTAQRLTGADAGMVTELVAGTCRGMGTYDVIIEAASGRRLRSLQPAVVDLLRLATHQALGMGTPPHAAVTTSVDLARAAIGERVTGLVNAVVRRIAAHDLDGWLDLLSRDLDATDALALRTLHPRWIVEAWADVLPTEQLEEALRADNVPAVTTLVVRPGLADRDELLASGGEATPLSPFGVRRPGAPGDVPAVRERRAGVQDEGSQLVTWALARMSSAPGPWLDLCAGPGGKSALLAGLARDEGAHLVAAELQPHRAALVASAVSGYGRAVQTVVADGTRPAWRPGAFAKVLADVPCSGLGALR
ncbi:MAG TPA: transcription antitermination factor NusB, partial [Propionibacteriaceae bacterium]|nr:transcription antitermination factor NusB [Propionibacteriaceae bacterium]